MTEFNLQDFAVTLELFEKWCVPPLVEENPTRLDNPVWEWLIHSRVNAYQAKALIKEQFATERDDLTFPTEPGWCFDRFGQAEVVLPDGRQILIGGEHEDSYDPDFYIYNDVVVIHPDQSMAIYGYPRDIFPPTDFHTATLIDNQTILIIGNLGYPQQRIPETTPIYRLNLADFTIDKITATGTSPGWIHNHQATCSADGKSILVTKGLNQLDGRRFLFENIDDWQLHLPDYRWERLTHRKWPRWVLSRSDGYFHHLNEMDMILWMNQSGNEDASREFFEHLSNELGHDPDIEMYQQLYRPPIAHDLLPDGDEYNVHRIQIDGVVVRYVVGVSNIQVIVEGQLPEDILATIQADVRTKFGLLENIDPLMETFFSP